MVMRGLSGTVGELYQAYPKHVGKRAAERAIANALQRLPKELQLAERVMETDTFTWMKEAVDCFAGSPAGKNDGLFFGYRPPYPSTWFNQSRYLDDPESWFEVSMSRKEIEEQRLQAQANVGVWRPQ